MYGIDIAHVQLISTGYRYEFADNRYTKVTIFISRSDGQSDYRYITRIDDNNNTKHSFRVHGTVLSSGHEKLTIVTRLLCDDLCFYL